jgi:hypothetical protein
MKDYAPSDVLPTTWMASKTVLNMIRSDFLILLTTKGRGSVTLPQCDMTMSVGDCLGDICELFVDIFESVYNVDTCD